MSANAVRDFHVLSNEITVGGSMSDIACFSAGAQQIADFGYLNV